MTLFLTGKLIFNAFTESLAQIQSLRKETNINNPVQALP